MEVTTSRYTVVLRPSEEGFAVSCPGLPGCWSQGTAEQESLENIQDAIREYLAAVGETAGEGLLREVEVTV
jgi:predicted RNase H-like HicB family nuclease